MDRGYLDSYVNAEITDMTATANSHLLGVMAGSSSKVRIANLIVRKAEYHVPISEETWIDLGHEPSPGYWRRQEELAIWRGRLSVRIRLAWGRLTAEPRDRITHALQALRGEEHERGDW